MTELESWFAANDRYLADALAWIRQRLERLAHSDVNEEVVHQPRMLEVPPPPRRNFFQRLLGWPKPRAEAPGVAMIEVGDTRSNAREAPSVANSAGPGAGGGPQPATLVLMQRLGLSDFERNTLLLCAAMELDTRIGEMCALAQHDNTRPYPTFALALALFEQPSWDVLSPERPLRYWRLVEINQQAAQPLVHSALRADERIVNYLRGLNYLDDRLAPLMTPMVRDEIDLPPSQAAIASSITRSLERRHGLGLPIVQLMGSDSHSKHLVAQEVARQVGVRLFRISAESIPSSPVDQESFLRLWQRECALTPVSLYVDASQLDRAEGLQGVAIQRLLMRTIGVTFLDVRDAWPDVGRETVAFDVAKPDPAEQRSAWEQLLGPQCGDLPERLSGQFTFNTPTIRAIAASTSAGSIDTADAAGEIVWRECLHRARPVLDRLAQPLEPKATWDDIELAAAETGLLRQIVEQVRRRATVYDRGGFRRRMNRGFGISALFAGESGTGKTMAAEVIANELDLLLYKIDLSAVVSKYIGETEKNLRKLFDAADEGGAILFFDEADALFGKRSEVKDSHDRYANIEINYLLQRMESYRGLAILATNMKAALDSAFIRRLRFIVTFPFPGATERTAMWRKAFPPETPCAPLDYERLARFNLTGGSIHSVAINAAFLAACAGTQVTMPLVLDAVRTEFRKLEKPVNEAEFRRLTVVEKRQ